MKWTAVLTDIEKAELPSEKFAENYLKSVLHGLFDSGTISRMQYTLATEQLERRG